MLTVACANVNGIRAAVRKGFDQWLETRGAEVVCLQEVRALTGEIPPEVLDGWHWAVAEAHRRGRNGVAVLTREQPSAIRIGFGSEEFDQEGRYVEVDLRGLTVGSLYLPKGEADTDRQEAKYRFMAEFGDYLEALRKRAEADGREVLICGDWNIAHREVDLKNWKTNQKNSGFLPEERDWLGRVFTELGYVDVARLLQPDGPGPYTWWSYRGRAYDNDVGWRIDYQVATSGLAERASTAVVDRAPSFDSRWSDHSAVVVDYDW